MIRGQHVEHAGKVWLITDVSSHRNYTSGMACANITYTLVPVDGGSRLYLSNPAAEQVKLAPAPVRTP